MTTADEAARQPLLAARETNLALSDQWRSLRRAATLVALISAPAVFLWLWQHSSMSIGWAIAATAGAVFAFRGTLDLVFRRFIPWPSLFATDDLNLRDEDVLNRRRATTWSFIWRLVRIFFYVVVLAIVWRAIFHGWAAANPWTVTEAVWHFLGHILTVLKRNAGLLAILPFYFIFNFAILMGPLMLMGISQIRGFEPGDANWGVKLEDVRGQAEAKEEVRRIVNLWQSGEAFEKAGGRRERGILFHGAPGTGKTMLAKAIATGFNSPFISIPGSGFAQTFIGIDALIVRYLARKAKKLASKWGGQCIVFIDEIDAVGMRRQSLGGAGGPSMVPGRFEDYAFYGPDGALNPSGDLFLETRSWRDRVFASREPARPPQRSGRLGMIVHQAFPGMFGGGGMGQLALNQLLVTMDGIDNPPFWRRFWTNRINTILDAVYVVPRRIGRVSLRLPAPRPAGNQIYFIGATNVPLEHLDPALRRPGRMGRHVWFRTPTKQDREDIFSLYLDKVTHDPELDSPRARDELARITSGYSPAMVEQVCSMALTRAHHDGRDFFTRVDIVEAMTTVESGTAIGVEYVPEETRAVAIHEAGHAAAAHVMLKGAESTRISIRMRAGSLGHHMALEKEERFSSWKHEEMAKLVWTLGAMAAEHVFYGENATGVGGDLQSATGRAAWMVGMSGHGPRPDRAERQRPPHRREARGGAPADREALRVDRPPADEPGERRLPARRDRRRPGRRQQARPRRADHRPGVPDRVQPRRPEQGGGGDDRRAADRAQGAVRRRAGRPAEQRRPEGAGDRPGQGRDMADLVSEQQPPAKPEPSDAVVIARRQAESGVPRHRFGIAYLLLAAILGAVVGLVVVFAVDGSKSSGSAWSTWKPTQTGIKQLDEIGKHVGAGYALANGRSLVAVYSTPAIAQEQGQAVPVRAIGVTPGLPGESPSDADFYNANGTWAYILCGLGNTKGNTCALPGKASVDRFDLLRREALELALYTFEYEKNVDSVLVYMPPASVTSTGDTANTLFFFRRADLKAALDMPVTQTITPAKAKLKPGTMSAAELAKVRRLTASRLYTYTTGSLSDGSPILVLQPVA